MRLIFLIACIAAALYYFRVQIGTTALPRLAEIGGAIGDAGASVSWPGTEAKKALIVERDRSAALEKALTALSDKLARTATEKASSDAALQSLRAAAESNAESIQGEHRRAEALAAQLAAVRQDAASQASSLGKQLADEQARSARLDRDTATARDRLAQTVAEQASADAAEQDLQTAAQSSTQKARDEHLRAEALAAQLASVKHDAASQVEALQKQIDGQKTLIANLTRDNGAPVGLVAQAPGSDGSGDEARIVPSTSDSPIAAPDRYALPEGMPTRVVLRYSGDSPPARAHAMSLVQTLQGQGVKIVALVAAPAPISESSVTYFYADDRGVATHLTDVLPEFRSKLHRSTPVDTIPRPGVIEIAVAA